MVVYRLVDSKKRAEDLSGTGAFRRGGRWNNKRTYLLYTSSSVSLALLETLVHIDALDIPPHLYQLKVEVDDAAPLLILNDNDYPKEWKKAELPATKIVGDKLMKDKKFLAIGVRSAVNEHEFNYLLNPLHPQFNNAVSIVSIEPLAIDTRLI